MPRAQVYSITMFILAGLLVVGFILNRLVSPVDDKHAMSEAELAADTPKVPLQGAAQAAAEATAPGLSAPVLLAWAVVGIPLAWGVMTTLEKVAVMFK